MSSPVGSSASCEAEWDRIGMDFTQRSNEELSALDIAELNLSVAHGLPGAEELDGDACLDQLDAWAQAVHASTQRWRAGFLRSPATYAYSEARFRVTALVTVLQRDLGVRYNQAFSEGDYDASDCRNLFLHGLLSGHGGTCVTMPVLYIAIGRRLGYPLKLVMAKEHLFARWEGRDGERFNIECTSPGFVSHDDAHYRQRPRPMSRQEIASGIFLRNLTPREELAVFLKERGLCWMDNLRMREALEAFYCADRFWPDQPDITYLWGTATVLCRAMEDVQAEAPVDGAGNIDLRAALAACLAQPCPRWAKRSAMTHLKRIFGNRAHRSGAAIERSFDSVQPSGL